MQSYPALHHKSCPIVTLADGATRHQSDTFCTACCRLCHVAIGTFSLFCRPNCRSFNHPVAAMVFSPVIAAVIDRGYDSL